MGLIAEVFGESEEDRYIRELEIWAKDPNSTFQTHPREPYKNETPYEYCLKHRPDVIERMKKEGKL